MESHKRQNNTSFVKVIAPLSLFRHSPAKGNLINLKLKSVRVLLCKSKVSRTIQKKLFIQNGVPQARDFELRNNECFFCES